MTIKFKDALHDQLKSAIAEKDEIKFMDTIEEISEAKAKEILDATNVNMDAEILRSRGIRRLTSQETAFYNRLIDAQKNGTVKDAVTGADAILPETIIDSVYSDIEENHPLLSKLDIIRGVGKMKMLYSVDSEGNGAIWGKLTDKITKELALTFDEVDVGALKVFAFIPVPNAYLDLGPAYLDNLVRSFLYNALARGIEKAVLTNLASNTGPISMMADLTKGSTTNNVTTYTAKTATAVTEWTAKGLASVLAGMAKDRDGMPRVVTGLYCVVNPTDYYTKLKPAICVQNASGDWVDRQPYPIEIIQSSYVPSGKAVLGMDQRYVLGISRDEKGQLESSTEYQFLDDNTVYRIKAYGNGLPKDNNAFAYLDISGLKEASLLVTNVTANVTAGGGQGS